MQNKILNQLNTLVKKCERKYGYRSYEFKTSKVIKLYEEDYHLLLTIEDDSTGFSLELQMSILVEESGINAVLFPSPRVVTSHNKERFFKFINSANRYLHRSWSLGRFYIDDEFLDLAYEIALPLEVVNKCSAETLEEQIFLIPLLHYQDMLSSITMLKEERWESELAIRYLEELRNNGYIDNEEYGI